MSLKTILTMLILGSSSVALAQPMVRDHRDLDTSSISISGGVQASVGFSTSPSYGAQFADYGYRSSNDRYDNDRYDNRFDNDRFDRHDRSRWNRGRWYRGYDRARFSREIMLAPASTMSLSNDGNAHHAIDTRLRVMSLQLEGFNGPQYIDYVVLHLADGTNQSVAVRRQLDESHQSLTINLGRYGASLRSLSVYGSSPIRTSLQITGVVR